MTTDRSLADSQPIRPKRSWGWLIYLGAAPAIVGAIAWATLNEITRNPARDATADLGPDGLVTLRLTTDPNPPLPTGAVQLSFMPMDSRQRTVPLDGISFEYGREGSDQPAGADEAQLMSDGSGMFTPALALRASAVQVWAAQFPAIGNWWVRARLQKGSTQAEVRFIL